MWSKYVGGYAVYNTINLRTYVYELGLISHNESSVCIDESLKIYVPICIHRYIYTYTEQRTFKDDEKYEHI